jgi:hypothetical protein
VVVLLAVCGAAAALSLGLAVTLAHTRKALRLPAERSSRVLVEPTPDVLVAVHELSRLQTTSYHMERVIALRDEQSRLFGLVQARDAVRLVAVGEVTAGVDLSQLTPGDIQVDWAHRRALLRLPPPQVFSATLDNARTYVYSRQTDQLAVRREDLEARARREAEATMRAGAIDAGIIRQARIGAEHALGALLRAVGFARVDFVWRELSEHDLPP